MRLLPDRQLLELLQTIFTVDEDDVGPSVTFRFTHGEVPLLQYQIKFVSFVVGAFGAFSCAALPERIAKIHTTYKLQSLLRHTRKVTITK